MADENLPEVAKKVDVPIVDGVLAPTSFDGLWRCVVAICQTDMAGDYKNKPEEAFVAAQLGMSVGMNYMQSLHSVAVIKKKPSLYGNATTALCEASGQMEDHQEFWMNGKEKLDDYDGPADLNEWPDDLKAVCIMQRRGVKTPKQGTFSVADAKRMKKWNKGTSTGNLSVWQKHPKDMLMWKARHRAQDALFPDVLKGFLPAAIAADYDTTDVEETSPGTYEAPAEKANSPSPEKANEPASKDKKQVAREMQYLIDFAKSHALSLSRLEEFVNKVTTENSTTLAALIPEIENRTDEFVAMFKNWDETTGSYVGQADQDQDSGPPVDDKTGSDSDSAENEPQNEEMSPEEGAAVLREMLNVGLEDYVTRVPEAFIDSDTESNLDAYLVYVAEMTERTNLEVLQLARNNPDNYFEYFFKWLADNPINQKDDDPEPGISEDPADEAQAMINTQKALNDPPEEPDNNAGNVEDPPTNGDQKGPEVPDIIANATKTSKKTYTPFVSEFKNMPAPRFKKWVMDNKDRLQEADVEDFKEAVRKWEKMRGEGKLKEEWPYPQQQASLNLEEGKTGALNARQRIANLKQTNPTETEMARKELGFATSVSEEAAGIWEKRTLEIIEDRAKKAARKRK